MSFPLITDPFFYAVTVPAVLLLGISKSGFGAGLGSLVVPMMAMAVSVPQAAAILMPVLLLMDLSNMAAYRKDFDRTLLWFLVPWGLVGIVLGLLLFKLLNVNTVAAVVGVFTLLFLAQRLLFPPRPDSPPPPKWLGAILCTTSGFVSFIAHVGGPPISAYVIPLRLSPVKFASTMAFFFFVINLSKWIPYAWLGLLDLRNMATSVLLLPVAPLGVFIGVRFARRSARNCSTACYTWACYSPDSSWSVTPGADLVQIFKQNWLLFIVKYAMFAVAIKRYLSYAGDGRRELSRRTRWQRLNWVRSAVAQMVNVFVNENVHIHAA